MLIFSVVIPLYNKESHIKRALESVLSQTLKEFEVIIVDDGSTDNSANIVKQFSDHRIKLVQQKNQGECAARNKGISESSTEYIAFLDADDEWESNFLEEIEQLTKKFPKAGLFATAYQTVQSNGVVLRKPTYEFFENETRKLLPNFFKSSFYSQCPISSSSVCVKRSVLDSFGAFPVGVKLAGDMYLWSKIAVEYPIAISSKICATYYRNAENRVCMNYLPAESGDTFSLQLNKLLKSPGLKKEFKKYITELDAKYIYLDSMKFLLAKENIKARKLASEVTTRNLPLLLKKNIVIALSFLPFSIVKPIARCLWDVNTYNFEKKKSF